MISIPLLIALAVTSQLVLSRLAGAQASFASQNPNETGWTPAMLPPLPAKPFSP